MKDEKRLRYRVRDITTGLYQKSGYDKFTKETNWSKRGKTWLTLDDLKNHFKLLEENRIPLSPLWEVVEILPTSKEGDKYPASVFSKKK
jgi:hypothetical protein